MLQSYQGTQQRDRAIDLFHYRSIYWHKVIFIWRYFFNIYFKHINTYLHHWHKYNDMRLTMSDTIWTYYTMESERCWSRMLFQPEWKQKVVELLSEMRTEGRFAFQIIGHFKRDRSSISNRPQNICNMDWGTRFELVNHSSYADLCTSVTEYTFIRYVLCFHNYGCDRKCNKYKYKGRHARKPRSSHSGEHLSSVHQQLRLWFILREKCETKNIRFAMHLTLCFWFMKFSQFYLNDYSSILNIIICKYI